MFNAGYFQYLFVYSLRYHFQWNELTFCFRFKYFVTVLYYIIAGNDIINWNYFPCYWPFVRGIQRSTVDSPHKGQWRGALMLTLICAWAKNRDVGDLKRHRGHYDVTVLIIITLPADALRRMNVAYLINTNNGSWCMGIKGEMSGTVCVTLTWDMYIYMSCL